jgi:uncharacterized protein (DUF1684 family)
VTHAEQVEAWRKARYARLTAPDGWLALVAKHPLARGQNSIALGVGTTRVVWDGARAVVGDHIVTAERAAQIGDVRLELLVRGEHAYLRVKDANAPSRVRFGGIPHYPVDARWRIEARFVEQRGERTIDLDYDGGTNETFRVAGEAVFELEGRERRLLLLHDTSRPRLYVLFRDTTSKDTTYGAGRFLYAPPAQDDRVVLDFNQAFNPPCALTPFASCPLVPSENRLDVRIEAGEMRPLDDG